MAMGKNKMVICKNNIAIRGNWVNKLSY